nr:Werner Syndrome-like exonuclease [Ipomoea batatas]
MDSQVTINPAFSPKPYRYQMFNVYCYNYHFRTTVTATPGVVRDWIFRMRRRHAYQLRTRKLTVGLGVQWTPITNPAATLQLAVGRECLIFQLTHAVRAPRALHRLLEDPDITRVGVNNQMDVAKVESSELRLTVGEVVDLVHVARACCTDLHLHQGKVSMEALAENILEMAGIKKPQVVAMSDWEAESLSEEQVQYACLDASISFLMGAGVLQGIVKLLRGWARCSSSSRKEGGCIRWHNPNPKGSRGVLDGTGMGVGTFICGHNNGRIFAPSLYSLLHAA